MAGENGRKAILADYMDYATVHGIGRSKNSPYLVFKLFWVLALLASLGMIIWQVQGLYMKYDSHPVSTSIEVKTAKRLKFPPITICNTNPAQYSLVEPGSTLDDVIQEASKKYSIDLNIYNSTDMYNYNFSAFDEQNKNSSLENDIMWITAEQFRMKMATLDDFTLENISQPLPEFFLLCNFAGKPCEREAITQIRSYTYGLCYKFEPEYIPELSPHGEVADAGPKYSLEILLNVDQSESIPFVTSSAGVVIGSDSRSQIFHENNGVFVPTGFETNIALSLDCFKSCKLRDIVNSCGCYLHFFNIGSINKSVSLNNTFDDLFGYSPCYTKQHYKCIQELEATYILQPTDDCDECLPPCSEIYYESHVSQSTWPGTNFIPILRKIFNSKLKDQMASSEVNRDYVRDNLALVRIYLSSLSYQVIKEEYAYSEVDFISDIGGQLGLWAGFSVLSLCEILELIFLLCASGMKRENTNPDNTVTPLEKK